MPTPVHALPHQTWSDQIRPDGTPAGRALTGPAMVEHLLDDPIVDLLLARDGLTRADVRVVMAVARAARARAGQPGAAAVRGTGAAPRPACALDRAA